MQRVRKWQAPRWWRVSMVVALVAAVLPVRIGWASMFENGAAPRAALSRLYWGAANGIVYSDSVLGTQLWVATAARATHEGDFSANFDPLEVLTFHEQASLVLTAHSLTIHDSVTRVGA